MLGSFRAGFLLQISRLENLIIFPPSHLGARLRGGSWLRRINCPALCGKQSRQPDFGPATIMRVSGHHFCVPISGSHYKGQPLGVQPLASAEFMPLANRQLSFIHNKSLAVQPLACAQRLGFTDPSDTGGFPVV